MESSWILQQSADLMLRLSNGQMPGTRRPKKLLPTPFVIEYIEGRCGLSTYIYRITDKYSTHYHYTWTSLFCTLSQLRMGTTSHSRAVTTDKIQRSLSRHTCSRPSRLLPAWVRRDQRAAATPTVPSCGPCTGHRVSCKTYQTSKALPSIAANGIPNLPIEAGKELATRPFAMSISRKDVMRPSKPSQL